MKLAQAIPIVAIALLVVAGGWLLSSPSNSPTGLFVAAPLGAESSMDTIRLGYLPIPSHAIALVALRKGFFAQEGLNVVESRLSIAAPLFLSLVKGDLDVAVGGETPGMFASFKDNRFVIVGQLTAGHDLVLVSRVLANIRSIRDLAGKRVGVSFSSVANYQLDLLLREANVDANAVTKVDLVPELMAPALTRGDVDAVFVWEPSPAKLQAGLGSQVTSLAPPTTWFVNVYASLPFSKKTETMTKVMRALRTADAFVQANPIGAQEVVAKEMGLDLATLKTLWPKYEFGLKPAQGLETMRQEAQWAIDTKRVSATTLPDFEAMSDFTAVNAVLTEK